MAHAGRVAGPPGGVGVRGYERQEESRKRSASRPERATGMCGFAVRPCLARLRVAELVLSLVGPSNGEGIF